MSHYERTFKEFEERCFLDYILKPNPAQKPFIRSYEGSYYVECANQTFQQISSMEG